MNIISSQLTRNLELALMIIEYHATIYVIAPSLDLKNDIFNIVGSERQ